VWFSTNFCMINLRKSFGNCTCMYWLVLSKSMWISAETQYWRLKKLGYEVWVHSFLPPVTLNMFLCMYIPVGAGCKILAITAIITCKCIRFFLQKMCINTCKTCNYNYFKYCNSTSTAISTSTQFLNVNVSDFTITKCILRPVGIAITITSCKWMFQQRQNIWNDLSNSTWRNCGKYYNSTCEIEVAITKFSRRRSHSYVKK